MLLSFNRVMDLSKEATSSRKQERAESPSTSDTKKKVSSTKAESKASSSGKNQEEWRNLMISMGMRDHIVRKFIQHSRDLCEFKDSTDDEIKLSAESTEEELFVTANSREEYYKMSADKIRDFDEKACKCNVELEPIRKNQGSR
jgi:carbamoylphosphate synthase small subunit